MRKWVLLVIMVMVCAPGGMAQAQSGSFPQGWGPEYRPGYCAGPDLMGWGISRGYGWGHGGMGPDMRGYHYSKRTAELCQKFMDETVQLRKEFFNKRFDYNEGLRNPKTSSDTLVKLEADMAELNQKIWAKNPHGCWWY